MSKIKNSAEILCRLPENIRTKTRVLDGAGNIIDETHPDWDYWHERHHEALYAKNRCENIILVKCDTCHGSGCDWCGNTGFQPQTQD